MGKMVRIGNALAPTRLARKKNVYTILLYIVISNLEFSSRILENFRENSGKIGKMLLEYVIVKEET